MLGCEKVNYNGANKNNYKIIELKGKELLKANQVEGPLMPQGFVFENDNIQYIVLNSGTLRVLDTKSGKILLEESGYWK